VWKPANAIEVLNPMKLSGSSGGIPKAHAQPFNSIDTRVSFWSM